MRKFLTVASAVVLFGTASMAQAGGISFNINVGGPTIVISQPPDFIYPAELGFGVAVGVPYDMFYNNGIYYVFRGGGWYQTSAYGGSWIKIRHRELPPELRRYKIERIHAFRDREYRAYSRDRDHYRGKRFTPVSEVREERRDMKAPAREERHDVKAPAREERREQGEQRHEKRGDERGDERR
jgi:hypothetical protein